MHIDIQPTGGLLSIPTEKIESEKNESDGIESEKIESWTRRKFVQVGSACAASLGLGSRALAYSAPQTAASMVDVPYDKREPRIAFIGVGGRGTSLLKNVLAAQGKIVSICDIVAEKADAASALVVAAGQPKPSTYTDGDHAYEKLLEEKNIDFVIVATPWVWHAPMALASMKAGKDVAIEVPGVVTLEDCWKIVDASEQTRKHCVMLENCCYGYNETLVLRMIHAGLLGDLLYGEGAYLHDLREELFSSKGEGLWRRAEHTMRNGNLYPTHGLGPVANYMGINRGDGFSHLVSMSTPQMGLDQYRKAHLDPSDPRMKERYVTGDMNISLIKTHNGLTITVKHTVSTPHPYDRINQIAGTKGIFEDYPARIYLDGQAGGEAWTGIEAFKSHEHPLWTDQGKLAEKLGGHGGMDFILLYRLLQCVREGLPPDMDVYDAAAWSAVQPLSIKSVVQGSAPAQFPDFTRGKWKQRAISAIAMQA
jgi:predicted dehydrogenase